MIDTKIAKSGCARAASSVMLPKEAIIKTKQINGSVCVTNFCDFHPVNEAHWQCPDCHCGVCQDCIPEFTLSQERAHCPQCRAPLALAQSKPIRQGIWQLGAGIVRLSISPLSLAFTLLLGLTSLLLSMLAVPSAIIYSLVVVTSFAFGGTITDSLSRSRREANHRLAIKGISRKFDWRVWSSFVLKGLVAIGLATAFTARGEYLLLAGGIVVLVFTLPALMLMPYIQAIAGEHRAINRFVRTIAHLGSDYAALGVWALAIAGSLLVLTDMALFYVPQPGAIALTICLTSQAIVLWCVALGRVAGELNRVAVSQPKTVRKLSQSRSLDAKLDLALLNGDYDRVIALLETAYFRSDVPDFRLEQLFRLLLAQENWTALQKYSYPIMSLLMARGRLTELVSFLKALRKQNPDYRVRDVALCLDLVRVCVRCNESSLLLWLIQDAHIRFPESGDAVAEMYRDAGKILHREFKDHRKALAYLRVASKASESSS